MKQFNNQTINSSFESTFPSDYRKTDIEATLRFIQTGRFCQLISLPGGGKATLLKLLAFNKNIKEFHLKEKKDQFLFIYLNLLELPNFEQSTVDKFLLLSLGVNESLPDDPLSLSEKLKEKISQTMNHEQKTLILLFDHFDEFQNQLARSFFQTLRTLRNLAKYRFSSVFATRRDLQELVDNELLKEFYDFFVDNTVYMSLYDKSAISFIFSQIEKIAGEKLTEEEKDKLIELTGGHTKILKVCAETVLLEKTPVDINSLLTKQIVKASLYELWLFLTAEEQKSLIDVALNKPVEPDSALDNLLNFGFLKQSSNSSNNNNFSFTIPIFEEFVKNIASTLKEEKIVFDQSTREIKKGQNVISDLLSPLEFRLLRFLVENKERIIERDEIINSVWNTKSVEGVTDQAIDQLIFRLRRKIEDDPNNPKHLLTIKGRGLRFIP